MSNRDEMMTANIQLHHLTVRIISTTFDLNTLTNLLNNLYERGFYEKLSLNFDYIRDSQIDELATVKGLNELFVPLAGDSCSFSPLKYLEELETMTIIDPEVMANNLINLECIYLLY